MSLSSTAGPCPGGPAPGLIERDLIERDRALQLGGLTRWMRVLLRLAAHLEHGTVLMTLPAGPTVVLRGRTKGPVAEIHVHDQRMAKRILLKGGIGFAESHLAGEWDSPDLVALLGIANVNDALLDKVLDGAPVTRLLARLGHALNRNSRSGSRRNIAHHYDLGNRFYGAWLDPSMTYSAAVFPPGVDDLAGAQAAKYDLLAGKLGLGPDHHLLEIGCGWGGFAERAAASFGCRVTAVTISAEQYAFARRRIFEAGLAERVEIRLQDYRDIRGRFDHIASIEMFEAVGERYWPVFFDRVAALLAPGGRAALQVITIAETYFPRYRRHVDFIQKYVFPGGMLPSPAAFERAAAAAGLARGEVTAHGPDYARTLAAWRGRFLAAFDDLRPLGFDDRFRRLWTYYLAYCEAGFRTASIDVMQVALHKG
ncbi:SAM-dependent methyltransferase [Zavarzinia compransoris]|uniref:SAM-dependent methyltransferase n=1 Tax=Zavarzinia compransoris TaxID=1264899 RepID=A0A317EAT0_9PROT|nr:cyclopropane-fatty-acyl-phospholipid synthase family protein [Zavarzinia compransoris]PWR23336.1 SAM-dependent methyltransferase [Zavarzinia compransoris]TDP46090.1 cyclopropane-fatty-acyl-phospholipid synthase [Zavarzinia compransoris]